MQYSSFDKKKKKKHQFAFAALSGGILDLIWKVNIPQINHTWPYIYFSKIHDIISSGQNFVLFSIRNRSYKKYPMFVYLSYFLVAAYSLSPMRNLN